MNESSSGVVVGEKRGLQQAMEARSEIAFMIVERDQATTSDVFNILHEMIDTDRNRPVIN